MKILRGKTLKDTKISRLLIPGRGGVIVGQQVAGLSHPLFHPEQTFQKQNALIRRPRCPQAIRAGYGSPGPQEAAMKYLALDYGAKRVGLAATDPEGSMAFPRRTLIRRTRAAFFRELAQALGEERPDALVLGLPLLRGGAESLTTRQVRNFAASLKRRTALPLYWMEEELSSHEAECDLRASGRGGRKDRALIDQQAAVRILESFLAQPETARKPA